MEPFEDRADEVRVLPYCVERIADLVGCKVDNNFLLLAHTLRLFDPLQQLLLAFHEKSGATLNSSFQIAAHTTHKKLPLDAVA